MIRDFELAFCRRFYTGKLSRAAEGLLWIRYDAAWQRHCFLDFRGAWPQHVSVRWRRTVLRGRADWERYFRELTHTVHAELRRPEVDALERCDSFPLRWWSRWP